MKKSLSRGPTLAAAPDVLAGRGTEALRLGRFREAMEIFKQLARQDPRPEWTHRLADAYAGRAHALAEKGMFKEAALVLENTMSPDGIVREPVLYLTSLIRQGQHQRAKLAALKFVDQLPAAEASRVAELAAALSLATPVRAETPAVNPPGRTPWVELCHAAQAALGAWLQGKAPDEVDLLLARIPLRSPFGPLRLILKSLITPPGASAKAISLLRMIPPESLFAPVRAAVEATLADEPAILLDRWSRLLPAQREFVAASRGLLPAATALLDQILDAERRGPAALFTLLTRPGLSLPAEDLRIACLNLLPAIPEYLNQFDRRFEPLSPVERDRVLALAAEAREDWLRAQSYWDAVADTLSRQPTPEARLARAVVLRHLADLAEHHPDVRGNAWGDVGTAYLERSLEADPDHLPTTLTLIERYRTADDPKDWHRATDLAAQRFPGNTAVLLHAVDAAVARSAYRKAVGFARRLLTLDPINQPVRQRMIELQLAHARKQMRSGRADLASKTLSQAAEWERSGAPSAPLRIGQALAAMQATLTPEAEASLREAVQLAGGGSAGWFRAVLEAALMGWSDQLRQPLHRELAAAQAEKPDREAILSIVAMLGQNEIRDSKRVLASLLWRIEPILTDGSSIAWSTAEFLAVAASLHQLGAFDALGAYARDAMKRDPTDPTARFYRIVAQAKGNSDRLTVAQEHELVALMDQATSRQNFHFFNKMQHFLEGPDKLPTGRKRSGYDTGDGSVSAEDMEELLAMAIAGSTGLPDKEVRKLVKEFGRDRAIDMLTGTVADSPLGGFLSPDQVAQLCAVIVGQAMEGRRQQARR